MTLIDLQREAAALDLFERRKLMAFLVALNLRSDTAYQKEIAGRLQEDKPGSWITMEEAERRLGDTGNNK